jgi:hypothetical protein
MDNLIKTARKRFSELTEVLRAADDVRKEWQELKDFLEIADKIERRLDPTREPSALPVDSPLAPTPRAVTVKRTENSLEIADYVFAVHGPELHVDEVLGFMLETGWVGSGDRRKDYKNIHQLLASKPTRFRSLGKGRFERVEDAKAART